jgi:hypothetical protein
MAAFARPHTGFPQSDWESFDLLLSMAYANGLHPHSSGRVIPTCWKNSRIP